MVSKLRSAFLNYSFFIARYCMNSRHWAKIENEYFWMVNKSMILTPIIPLCNDDRRILQRDAACYFIAFFFHYCDIQQMIPQSFTVIPPSVYVCVWIPYITNHPPFWHSLLASTFTAAVTIQCLLLVTVHYTVCLYWGMSGLRPLGCHWVSGTWLRLSVSQGKMSDTS